MYGPGLLALPVASEGLEGRAGLLVSGSLERAKKRGGGRGGVCGSLTGSLGLAGPAGVGRAGGETRCGWRGHGAGFL